MAPLSMRPIGTSLASAACASADIPSRASGGVTCQTFGRPAATKRSSRFFASGSSGMDITPAQLTSTHAVALQDLAHGVDQLVFCNRELRRPALAPFLMRGDRSRGFGAFDQILDLQFALRALVAALDDHAGRAAPVGIFHLRLHAGGAEIDLGADVRRTQPAGEILIIADALAVEHEDH